VTPGYAQPRSKLPWLPYESLDRVIINSHNFTPAETFNVNGKVPVSVWCPSRDTTGNGTTTLTDLVGSNNGVLTNMDAATDWVADTGSGGVRALDFDGANDLIVLSAMLINKTSFSLSMWFKTSDTRYGLFSHGVVSGFTTDILLAFDSSIGLFFQVNNSVDGQGSVAYSNTGNWAHVVAVFNGAGTGNAGRMQLYLNGTLQTLSFSYTVPSSTANVSLGSAISGLAYYRMVADSAWNLSGRLDDVRLFDAVLDLSDAAYLYNSGDGRGRVA